MLKKKAVFHILNLGALMAFAWGCGAEPEENSETKFQVGWVGPGNGCDGVQCNIGLAGHEPITRLGQRLANDFIGDHFYFDYGEDPGTRGGNSSNPLVRGNFATDKPTVINDFDITGFQEKTFGVPKHQPWHEGPDRQVFHALRNFKEDLPTLEFPGSVERTVDTNKQTCLKVRNVILQTSVEAAKGWQPNLPNMDKLLLVGSTTHTIQDSFSTVHLQRTADHKPLNFCKYGEEIPGLCHHSMMDAVVEDLIWKPSSGFMVMKPEAKLAAQTTALYLLHFQRIVSGKALPVTEMNDFLDGSSKLRTGFSKRLPPAGSFDCESLQSN